MSIKMAICIIFCWASGDFMATLQALAVGLARPRIGMKRFYCDKNALIDILLVST